MVANLDRFPGHKLEDGGGRTGGSNHRLPSFPLFSSIFCCHLPSLTRSPSNTEKALLQFESPAQHSNQILPKYRYDTMILLTTHYTLQWLQDWLSSALISHINLTHTSQRSGIFHLQMIWIWVFAQYLLWPQSDCMCGCACSVCTCAMRQLHRCGSASVQSSSVGGRMRGVHRCVYMCRPICMLHVSQAAICI